MSEPDKEGWIEWGGGKKCPAPDRTVVETKFSDGSGSIGEARLWDWHDEHLVAYRRVSP